jgi:Lipid A 3-O-deacylase (PagL)
MKPPFVFFLSVGLFVTCGPTAINAQDGPEKGGRELEIWTGGGHGVKGIASDIGVWTVGGRYGWILTSPHGPGFLQGKFEYGVDVVPVFWIFQPGGVAYGVAIDPFAFKWNFNPHGRYVPYADLDGGVLVTSRQTPPGTSRTNFTPSAALGMHILGKRLNWSAEVRYVHISNAGIASINPGMNTLQLRIGVGMFTRPRGN